MTKSDEIVWKSTANYKVDAKVAYAEIQKIVTRNGGEVRAEDVVAAAGSKRSLLHVEFEWNDTVAGMEYRLMQARQMLRSFVTVRSDLSTDRPQRAMQIVKAAVTRGQPGRAQYVYRNTEDILRDPEARAELLARALRELISMRYRFRDLQELAVVMRAIDEVVSHAK